MKTIENSNLRKSLTENLDEIKEYYMNHTQKETASKFGCSTATLTRLLKENGIIKSTSRHFSDAELYPRIKELQLEGKKVVEICKILDIHDPTYRRILKKGDSLKKDAELDENSDLFWYILGFFTADGHREEEWTIYLSQSDHKFLEEIKNKLDCGNIGPANKGVYKYRFYSSKILSILDSYNIGTNKSYNIPFIKAPTKELQNSFIRGVFDGDGCIYFKYVSYKFTDKQVNICSASENFINELKEYLESYGITCIKDKISKTNCYIIYINSYSDILKFADIIYKQCDCSIKLERKYITFIKLKYLIKLNNSINKKYDIVDGTQK